MSGPFSLRSGKASNFNRPAIFPFAFFTSQALRCLALRTLAVRIRKTIVVMRSSWWFQYAIKSTQGGETLRQLYDLSSGQSAPSAVIADVEVGWRSLIAQI